MKISVSMWSYRSLIESKKTDYLGFVDEVKRIGGQAFEIFPSHLDQSDPAGAVRKLAEKARKEGLEISSLIAGNDFNKATTKERAEQVEKMKWSITTAAANGIFLLNSFTGYHIPGTPPVQEMFRVIDCYKEVMPLAEEKKVRLAIENHSSVCSDADGLMDLIERVGSPNLGTNPDISNFVPEFARRSETARNNMYPECERIAGLAMNAHIKVDEFTDKGEHPHIDIGRYLDILKKTGYDGHMVIEYYGQGDCALACSQGVKLLKKYIK